MFKEGVLVGEVPNERDNSEEVVERSVDDLVVEYDDSEVGEVEGAEGVEDVSGYQHSRWPILDSPTEEIHAELRKVDPLMAARWHPKDRRHIQRSLEIWLQTGRKASEVYEEQKKRKEETSADVDENLDINGHRKGAGGHEIPNLNPLAGSTR